MILFLLILKQSKAPAKVKSSITCFETSFNYHGNSGTLIGKSGAEAHFKPTRIMIVEVIETEETLQRKQNRKQREIDEQKKLKDIHLKRQLLEIFQ